MRTRASHPSRLDVSVWGRVGSKLRLGISHHRRKKTVGTLPLPSIFHTPSKGYEAGGQELEKERGKTCFSARGEMLQDQRLNDGKTFSIVPGCFFGNFLPL